MTKPNAIEEIMAGAVLHCDPAAGDPRRTYLEQARSILAALDAAGLTVVPKETDWKMETAVSFVIDEEAARACWSAMAKAFDPTTWKSKT